MLQEEENPLSILHLHPAIHAHNPAMPLHFFSLYIGLHRATCTVVSLSIWCLCGSEIKVGFDFEF